MKTELEKCMAGEWYDCHDPYFLDAKRRACDWLVRYNSVPYGESNRRYEMLKSLFGSVGNNVSVADGFICGFGNNIYIGDNVSINLRCTLIDCNRITIGSNVLIGPNVQVYTSAHPVELTDRLNPDFRGGRTPYFCRTFALPVTIGDGCWIGGGTIVLPGVTIGDGCVIGAGSVVTKNVAENSLAVGNPCRVVRALNQKEDGC